MKLSITIIVVIMDTGYLYLEKGKNKWFLQLGGCYENYPLEFPSVLRNRVWISVYGLENGSLPRRWGPLDQAPGSS